MNLKEAGICIKCQEIQKQAGNVSACEKCGENAVIRLITYIRVESYGISS